MSTSHPCSDVPSLSKRNSSRLWNANSMNSISKCEQSETTMEETAWARPGTASQNSLKAYYLTYETNRPILSAAEARATVNTRTATIDAVAINHIYAKIAIGGIGTELFCFVHSDLTAQ